MINSVSTLIGSIPSYYNGRENTNKIEVPLPSGISVYAQFKYVRGVPASPSQEPVSLNRAQIIDNMVSYLNNKSSDVKLNPNEEYHVDELESEIHRVVNKEKPKFQSLPGKSTDTGIIFSLTA